MMSFAITPMRLHHAGRLNDRELLSTLRPAESGRCYASVIELMRYAVDRGLDLDGYEGSAVA